MILKLWCWLFGHIIKGKTDMEYLGSGRWMWTVVDLDKCPRCGAKL